MVPAALGKWKKDINDLDIPVCNQDHKTATVVNFPLAKEEMFYFAAVPWFVGIFCIKQSGESTKPGRGRARFGCFFGLKRFPSFLPKGLAILAN